MRTATQATVLSVLMMLGALAPSSAAEPDARAQLDATNVLAVQGDPAAQYALGGMYYNGRGVARDTKLGIEWMQKAAAQGHAQAQYSMGVVYYNGQFLPKDYQKAFELFSLAAAQGDLDAKYNLGVMNKNGEGVEKNLYRAFTLFSETAERGVKNAQIHLAGMYLFGDGVPVDLVSAYMWAKISDQIDLRGLKGNYAVASVSRAAPIEKKMSAEQLAQGRQRVSDWLSQHAERPVQAAGHPPLRAQDYWTYRQVVLSPGQKDQTNKVRMTVEFLQQDQTAVVYVSDTDTPAAEAENRVLRAENVAYRVPADTCPMDVLNGIALIFGRACSIPDQAGAIWHTVTNTKKASLRVFLSSAGF